MNLLFSGDLLFLLLAVVFISWCLMSDLAICTGTISQSSGVPVCSVDWTIIPYVEPIDSTAIYAQLVALNEFDPVKIASLIIFCFVIFIMGFGAGQVIKRMQRS